MKIVISDYEDTLNRNLDYEINLIKAAFPICDVVIHVFKDNNSLIKEVKDADGLITAFLKVDEQIFKNCPKLKCISINATGYDNINIEDAKKYNVTICAIKEYCTIEVAEFTMTLILSLAKKIKYHQHFIEDEKRWQYSLVESVYKLAGKTLAIYGLGRIGQSVAARAKAFDINVVAVDPYIPTEIAYNLNIPLVNDDYVFKNAHIISNHMNVSTSNIAYFDYRYFYSLQKRPIFINVGRGACVVEDALVKALDNDRISSAGLDVLIDENPDINNNPLFNRNNVIITPHAAFYSTQSSLLLQEISCNNLIEFFNNNLDKINYVVNKN